MVSIRSKSPTSRDSLQTQPVSQLPSTSFHSIKVPDQQGLIMRIQFLRLSRVSIRSKSPTSRDETIRSASSFTISFHSIKVPDQQGLQCQHEGCTVCSVSIRSKSPTSRDKVVEVWCVQNSSIQFPFDQSPRLAGTQKNRQRRHCPFLGEVSIRSKSPTSRDQGLTQKLNIMFGVFPFDQSPRLAGTNVKFLFPVETWIVSIRSKSPTSRDFELLSSTHSHLLFPFDQSPRLAGTISCQFLNTCCHNRQVSIRSKSPTSRDTSFLHPASADQKQVSIRSKSPTSRDLYLNCVHMHMQVLFPFDQSPRLAGTRGEKGEG